MKILICDDDTMTIRLLEYQFKRDGFEVFKANSGREARNILLENEDIKVLITDVYMPSMNGLELITFVRNELKKSIPIVVISRVNVDENIHEALSLEADVYMTKPFNLDDLSHKVNQLLKK
jgi:DNA-binding response OmpR family regulator